MSSSGRTKTGNDGHSEGGKGLRWWAKYIQNVGFSIDGRYLRLQICERRQCLEYMYTSFELQTVLLLDLFLLFFFGVWLPDTWVGKPKMRQASCSDWIDMSSCRLFQGWKREIQKQVQDAMVGVEKMMLPRSHVFG
ncbi:hypothetical protein BDP27DRAFT_1371680 [Rhodocollybia butyracea]|uniref:Uncharacterized protein n=1 Tax=Rhodocollybia butyracea TaxID=206335 RepID=A0A9P5PBK4_9AGAR|nr:hypothetical protein BDP27DRAFT_1371680 [Rhodocollybia butyracea]